MSETTPSPPRSMPWIERLVGLDTTSRDSNLPLIEAVADYVRGLGLKPHVFPDDDGDKANLLVTVPASDGSTSGGVMLSGHTDVVPVDGQDWDSDPFTASVRDGRIYGRGTCDMKAFSAAALTLLPEFVEAELEQPLHLALSYDEEVGCLGGAAIVKQIADLGLAPRLCVVGEPTSMRVVPAHKSINVLTATFTGVAAHSSLTPQGVNAIEYAARFVTAARGIADGWRSDGPADDAYLVPSSTMSVNRIQGGIAQNTVPDRCVVEMEFRTIAAVDPDETVERLRGVVDGLAEEMRAENAAAGATLEVLAAVPGLDTPTDSPAIGEVVGWGGLASEGKVTYGTEAGQFSGSGIATVVCGPGDIAQAHAANEYVALDQVRACEEMFGELLAALRGPGVRS